MTLETESRGAATPAPSAQPASGIRAVLGRVPAIRRARELAWRGFGLLDRLRHPRAARWECPICGYVGPFGDVVRPWGARRHARCPACGSLERHRLQHLALSEVLAEVDTPRLAMLHFAPEGFFRRRLARRFRRYLTVDLVGGGVDLRADLCRLPFADGSFDVVLASHVLEHVRDDRAAIAEIWRILRPGGIAVLPVPLVSDATVEYPAANPHDWGHWRAPGRDYFDRYRERFGRVREIDSTRYPERHQLYAVEDMTCWPTAEVPLRRPVPGDRHVDVVPVCYKDG
jgi:SAM-dependent methyltransferase